MDRKARNPWNNNGGKILPLKAVPIATVGSFYHRRKKFKPSAKNCECDIANTPYLKVVEIVGINASI